MKGIGLDNTKTVAQHGPRNSTNDKLRAYILPYNFTEFGAN